MIHNWTYKKIGEVMDVKRGGSPRPIKKYLTDSPDGLNWIKIGDASESSKYITKTKEKITKEGLHKTRFVKEGDFLLSNSMSFGRPYIMKTTGCIHDGWLVLSEKNENELDKDFLYYLLGSPYIFSQFDKLAAGSTVRNLNIALVSSVEIPIPPLSEQQRIVAILDQVFEAIDQAKAYIEKNIENAKELFKSRFNYLFSKADDTWEKITLLELLERNWITSHLDGNHGGDYPRKNEFIDSGVPYLSANCLKDGYVDFSKAKFLSEERAGKLRKGIAQNNDVLFAHNATVGPTALLITEEPKVILGTSLTYYRCNQNYILPKYLLLYLRSKEFTTQYEAVMRQMTRNQVPITKQRTFYHIIPPLEVQAYLIPKLEMLNIEVEEIVEKLEKKLDLLNELKKSILHKAFAGELTNKTVEV